MFKEVRQINQVIPSQIREGIPNLRERGPIVTRQVAALIKLPEQSSDGSFTPIARSIGSRNLVVEIETVKITPVGTAGIAPDRIVSNSGREEVRPAFGPRDAWIQDIARMRLAAGRIITRESRGQQVTVLVDNDGVIELVRIVVTIAQDVRGAVGNIEKRRTDPALGHVPAPARIFRTPINRDYRW